MSVPLPVAICSGALIGLGINAAINAARRRRCIRCWRPFAVFTGKLCRRCWRVS